MTTATERFFYSVTLADDEVPLPSRVQILRSGTFNHKRFGEFTIDRTVMENIAANFEPDRVPLDYNHGSLSENPDQSKAAGWVKSLEIEDGAEGSCALFANVEFTPKAREHVAADEFRYISPEFTFHYANPESGEDRGAKLVAVALTNRPFLPGMLPITLKQDGTWADEDFEMVMQSKIDGMSFSDGSLSEQLMNVTRSFYAQFRDSEFVNYMIEDIRDDNVIVKRSQRDSGERMFQVGYATDNGAVAFAPPDEWVPVRKAFIPDDRPTREAAPVATPRLSRTPATESSTTTVSKENGNMDEQQLRAMLGLKAEDDVAGAISSLIKRAGQVDELQKQLQTLNDKVDEMEKLQEESAAQLTDAEEKTIQLTEEKTAVETERAALDKRLDALDQERIALNERVMSLEEDVQAREAQTLILKAQTDRKLTPAECAPDAEGKQSEWVRLAAEEPNVFKALIDRKPAYSEDLLKVVSSQDGNDTSSTPDQKFWSLVESRQAENPDMMLHDVRDIVCREHPEVAKAAGMIVREV
ncbi:MAG: hypothetical protein KKD77_24450 [Gammaproteobacteria bacterium]|nr:hypothetical protein [Gammaproteobacteria bacterium]